MINSIKKRIIFFLEFIKYRFFKIFKIKKIKSSKKTSNFNYYFKTFRKFNSEVLILQNFILDFLNFKVFPYKKRKKILILNLTFNRKNSLKKTIKLSKKFVNDNFFSDYFLIITKSNSRFYINLFFYKNKLNNLEKKNHSCNFQKCLFCKKKYSDYWKKGPIFFRKLKDYNYEIKNLIVKTNEFENFFNRIFFSDNLDYYYRNEINSVLLKLRKKEKKKKLN